MRLLLIGGTGFFGRSLLDYLQRVAGALRGGDEVIFASRRADSAARVSCDLLDVKLSFLQYDILSGACLPDCDVVIHAAASSDAQRYVADPEAECEIIVEGTRRLMGVLSRMRSDVRLVYVSSGAVYGRQPTTLSHIIEEFPFETELDAVKARYTLAKREAERAVAHYARSYDRSAIIARCFAFVGPLLPIDSHFAIGNIIGDIEAARPINIRAANRVYRSYMSTDDLWICLLRMGKLSSFRGEAFNVGSDKAVELHDLARILGQKFGVGYSGLGFDNVDCGNDDIYVPDVSKVASVLELRASPDPVELVSLVLKQRHRMRSAS